MPGGATRQGSVRAGLQALAPHAPDIVLVHDAARPFLPPSTIPALLAALRTHDGAIPAVPVADTLKRVQSGRIVATVPRDGLFRAQTPQAFRYHLLRALHATAGPAPPTTPRCWRRPGHPVAIVPGADDNIKLTYPEDLVRLERALAPRLSPRTGTGFDVHALESRPAAGAVRRHRPARLGPRRPFRRRCRHPRAVRRDLRRVGGGRYRPPLPAQRGDWKDADSARFLRHAAGRIAARGGLLANADVTLICERPKITPHAPAMIARLAELLGVEPGRISVKATTTERLGFAGRGEGIAAQAIATILLPA